jgi:TPR repeat protein
MKFIFTCIFISLISLQCVAFGNEIEKNRQSHELLSQQPSSEDCYLKAACGIPIDLEQLKTALERQATSGNSEAQYRLGRLLFLYFDTNRFTDETKKWLEMASNQGNRQAKLLLQIAFEKELLSKEEQKSLWALCIEEAETGSPDNQYYLGKLYALPRAGIANLINPLNKDAEKWLKLAAEQGLVQAQVSFGRLYEELCLLCPTEPDKAKIEKWYKLAADQGYADGEYHLGHYYYYSIYLMSTFSEKPNIESRNAAFKWLSAAAAKNYIPAMMDLGNYYDGSDNKKAIEWYLKAKQEAERQKDDAKLFLWSGLYYSQIAEMYLNGGHGLDKDVVQARDWYRRE